MNEAQLQLLKYPVGRFNPHFEDGALDGFIVDISKLPEQIETKVSGLSKEELNFPYRPDGWTIKQVVHHLADSHMNSVMRHKLTLTEEDPIIKPYNEKDWSLLPDGQSDDLTDSINLLKSIHNKWMELLNSMSHEQFVREYVHPAKRRKVNLITNTALYAWHGKHHLAHIDQALKFKGDFSSL
jgi:hypothetical protein